jgi:hypothetical protein
MGNFAEPIKDLLKEHLHVEVSHPRDRYHDYNEDTKVAIYWDDELIR